MSFDSQRPGLPWSLNQTGTAHRPLSSLLSSSKSLIKLSVEDGRTPSVFWPGVHLTLPNNIQSTYPRGVQARIVSLLPISPARPFHLLVPPTHFVHGCEGALVFGEVFEKRIELAPSTFTQLFSAARFNAAELSSQHLFGLMPQPQKEESLGIFVLFYRSISFSILCLCY